ncbi:MAG: hypothetical protein RLZZ543_874 [Bacteroidota bacterium]|jgi:hypothetical protein
MKKTLLALGVMSAVALTIVLDTTSTFSDPSGAPQSATGSPADGFTCAKSGCHSGTASAQDGLITSDVPSTGYVPGSTYNITVSITQTGISKWGFAISPQNNAGTVLGSMIITNTTQTKLVSSRYVTHKTAGNSGSGSKTWSFNWTAPAAGTGDVPFYASVMAANGTGNAAGDQVYTDVYTVSEDITASVPKTAEAVKFSVFPNPIEGNNMNISFASKAGDVSRVSIMSMNGAMVHSTNYTASVAGDQQVNVNVADLAKGVYLIQVETPAGTATNRIIRR